ncbi:hypothetical protein X975_00565, partial [Stegodyphus mimosarum]
MERMYSRLFIIKSNISYDKMVSLSTDKTPAMIGKEKGLVKITKDKNDGLLSYQCIIHQAVQFCGKLKCHPERCNGQLDQVD